MGLLSFLKRSATAASTTDAGDDVQRIRVRARQRLIGAVVLIVAGVIGFPLLFETQPRPIPVDIPIEIARKDQVPPLVMPPARARAASAVASRPASNDTVITEKASDAGREMEAPAKAGVASAPASTPQPKAEKAPAVAVAAVPARPASATPLVAPRAASAAADDARPRTTTETKATPAKEPSKEAPKETAKKDDAPSAQGRFAVQVGAFSDAAAAREVRLKVEKLGLKTYTQVVETADGRRIRVRVGPFATRDDAEKAAGKVKSAGLSTALFPI
jgi:DedD protein